MADEANVPSHRWYKKENHVLLAKQHVTKALILAAGAALIPSDDLGAPVEAILSGTAGFAFDPVVANLKQDAAGSTPVVNVADPIGRMNFQWGNAPPNWQQATAGSRPALAADGMSYDGVDNWMATFSNLGFLNNAPACFVCERVKITSLALASLLTGFSETSTASRFETRVNADGSVSLVVKPIDGGASTTITTAVGLISVGTFYTVTAEADFAGTGNGRIWIDGALVKTQAITGAPTNTSATNSGKARKGGNLGGAAPTTFSAFTGARMVAIPAAQIDANRLAIQAWVDAA